MTQVGANIIEATDFAVDGVFERVRDSSEPLVFRGLAANWPLVQKSGQTTVEICDYLNEFYEGVPVTAFLGDSDIGGRIFYTNDMAETNFRQVKTQLDEVLEQIRKHEDDDAAPTVYMGSTALDYALPGLSTDNSLPRDRIKATVRIWIGNRTTVAAHYDVLENIACVCAGRRRFTLFPPDQLPNLYVGPIDFTPAGQSVSLVDLGNPDFVRFPRFAEALENAQSAVLEPGDAIYVPSMWWHHVEGLDSFNILINHWWRENPAYMGAPGDALLHAILSIRDLPEEQRSAWKVFFDHYIFNAGPEMADHIPAEKRGALAELDENAARKIRALLLNKLNR